MLIERTSALIEIDRHVIDFEIPSISLPLPPFLSTPPPPPPCPPPPPLVFHKAVFNRLLKLAEDHPVATSLLGLWAGVGIIGKGVGMQVDRKEKARKRRLGKVVDGFMVDAVGKSPRLPVAHAVRESNRSSSFRLLSVPYHTYPRLSPDDTSYPKLQTSNIKPEPVILSPPNNPLLLPLILVLLKAQYVVLLGLKELEEVEALERSLRALSVSASTSAHASASPAAGSGSGSRSAPQGASRPGGSGRDGKESRETRVDLGAGVWVGVLDPDDVSLVSSGLVSLDRVVGIVSYDTVSTG